MDKGIKWAILTAIISGISIFVNKFAVEAIKPALIFTGVKNFGVGILIISFLLLSGKWNEIKTLNKKEILNLSLIVAIGGFLPFYLFFEGLSQTSAINSSLIHKSLVLWVGLLGFKFLQEKLNFKQILGVLILFASNLVIGGFKGFQFSLGELMILGATLLWAIENIIAKKTLKTISPDLITGARMGLGSLLLVGLGYLKYPQTLTHLSLSSSQIFWLGLTMLTLLLYVTTWYRALKLAPASLVTAVLVGATIITNLLSVIFINQSLSWQSLVQAGMILLGISLLIKEVSQTKIKNKVII
ncbi:DMT family transporter [Candidatus Beckwithbacteria bacterium]|nr:DMT family transporter [Candidatus Beckwithbacteria bacterium]